MLSTPEHLGMPLDSWTSVAAGIYPAGFNPVGQVTAGLLRLGTRMMTRDGRVFRFCRAGGTTLVSGNIIQSSAPIAGNLAQTPAAAAIGATVVTITTITTTVTANQYSEGWLQVDNAPGHGVMYGIDGHNAATGGSGACTVNLYKDDPILVALTTASRVGLIANPYADVIVNPTTNTGVTVGCAVAPIVNAQYGWLQTWGPAAVLINGTPGVGIAVVISATTAGAVDVATVAAEINTRHIGHMMQVGVSTKNNSCFLRICP